MISTVRLYEQEHQAQEAARQLKRIDLRDEAILILTPAGDAAAAVASAIDNGRMAERYKQVCTQALQQGRTVLAVEPPFGWGMKTEEIMDSCGPVATESLPEYIPYNPSPLSDLLGIPTLVDFEHSINMKMLTRPGWHFSSLFGLGLLKNPEKPIIPMKVLTTPKSNWTRSFGLPLLSKNPDKPVIPMKVLTTPKSKRSSFGIPLLSKNPTPLSSLFNIPVLTKRQ